MYKYENGEEEVVMQLVTEVSEEAQRLAIENGFDFYQTMYIKYAMMRDAFELYEATKAQRQSTLLAAH